MPTPKTETPLNQAIAECDRVSKSLSDLYQVSKLKPEGGKIYLFADAQISTIKKKLQSLLPSEKEGLIEAYKDGYWDRGDLNRYDQTTEQWYQNKYSDGKQD